MGIREVKLLFVVVGWMIVGACETTSTGKGEGGTAQSSTAQGGGADTSDDVPVGGSPGVHVDPVCELTYITEATTESCYNCMKSECCAEMQACDQDEDCVFCINNPIDSSERCVDPSTFSIYPNRKNLDICQTDKCVPPCGADGGSTCTVDDCWESCYNYSTHCQ